MDVHACCLYGLKTHESVTNTMYHALSREYMVEIDTGNDSEFDETVTGSGDEGNAVDGISSPETTLGSHTEEE